MKVVPARLFEAALRYLDGSGQRLLRGAQLDPVRCAAALLAAMQRIRAYS
jgi:hypothetical protein